MKLAYLDLIGGASGDMLLGALLDSGLLINNLEAELKKLPIPDFVLKVEDGHRGGLHGTSVQVQIDEDVRYDWEGFRTVLEASELSPAVRTKAFEVFRRLEEAERRAHRVGPGMESPRPQELGSTDTIIDVLGVLIGLEILGVSEVYCSAIPVGVGSIASEHGVLPAAAPVTMELAAMVGAPLRPTDHRGEMVTPTGTALLTTIASFQKPVFELQSVGYGLGSRDPSSVPNAVGLWLGEHTCAEREELCLLETNIDDMNPQVYGFVRDKLQVLGAKDVWITPIQMKKDRPGVTLSVLISKSIERTAVDIIFKETTTLGIRRREVDRYALERTSIEIDTTLGRFPVKVKYLSGKPWAIMPEYEACLKASKDLGLPLRRVMRQIETEAEQLLITQDDA